MDDQNMTMTMTHHMDASRPALGFPLGTALLLIIIFCLSGFFSCCYHWDKLRALRRSLSPDTPTVESPPSKSTPVHVKPTQNESQSLPVIMPGDKIPKYIAWPCPCEPPKEEKVTIEVHVP